MDPNNNNCNTSYEDTSSVKAATSIGMQDKDKDFILELLCWHNEYRQVGKGLCGSSKFKEFVAYST